ncbi:dihydrodipicolinate reductase [Mycolicibacterium novocastrense]|uniref:NAD(P)H-dependent amine dehydrogenase family protein n=1 Tax=Mycolicibacterium novocastrense TaxID=59813 RepID=UPI000747F5DD|nr:dihydrodipicolinate reductase [Mycolicibacterium novocastrense]KUH67684.1 dihydrodipicolinate reductase [Mycolicibacterium novocastrense]KUH75953.1 dihydrodipicolinate reductase [Mycolicibacterium novocastrense]KUH78728.1 dihydrodipicolinate reductase [Mycolicibacterium novocastrense]
MTIRVVQWTTGQVAQAAVRAVLAQPGLELVGCYAWSEGKVGKDVGQLCGIPPLGISATSDIDTILALKPDVVLYMPMAPNLDEMALLLEAGVNVISTAGFITGHSFGEHERQRLHDAAVRGGVSLYGSGINPGLASVIALVSAAACREVDRITIHEAVDCTPYESPETWLALGFGSPPDTPGLIDMMRQRISAFEDAIEMMAGALHVELDEVRFTPQLGVATKHLDLGYMEISEGTVCGMKAMFQGMKADRPLLEMDLLWRLGDAMEPDWPIEHGYVMEISGVPNIRVRYEPVFGGAEEEYVAAPTANPAVNAIPAVVAANPGLVTAGELPLITANSIRRSGG